MQMGLFLIFQAGYRDNYYTIFALISVITYAGQYHKE